jgi:hypothetical protein
MRTNTMYGVIKKSDDTIVFICNEQPEVEIDAYDNCWYRCKSPDNGLIKFEDDKHLWFPTDKFDIIVCSVEPHKVINYKKLELYKSAR